MYCYDQFYLTDSFYTSLRYTDAQVLLLITEVSKTRFWSQQFQTFTSCP